jgi:hypothetical protein
VGTRARLAREADTLTAMSHSSTQCGIVNILEPYRPQRPVTGTTATCECSRLRQPGLCSHRRQLPGKAIILRAEKNAGGMFGSGTHCLLLYLITNQMQYLILALSSKCVPPSTVRHVSVLLNSFRQTCCSSHCSLLYTPGHVDCCHTQHYSVFLTNKSVIVLGLVIVVATNPS